MLDINGGSATCAVNATIDNDNDTTGDYLIQYATLATATTIG